MSSVTRCICVFFFRQVGWLSIEGTLHMREPKKGWKQSHLCLKNGYLSVNKERGVSSNSQFVAVKTLLISWVNKRKPHSLAIVEITSSLIIFWITFEVMKIMRIWPIAMGTKRHWGREGRGTYTRRVETLSELSTASPDLVPRLFSVSDSRQEKRGSWVRAYAFPILTSPCKAR